MEETENDLFISEPEKNCISHSFLRFENLILYKRDKKNLRTQILKNVDGIFYSGRLSLLLGPSGAGKTTLLNVLSGFKKNFEGNIYYNGEFYKPELLKETISYITQNFNIHDNLRVREILNFAANMKLIGQPESYKTEMVNSAVKVLNLEKCFDSLASSISGGELKRLSVAVELLTNPPIMFLDEPTSGLDIVSSKQILNYLRKLALDGRIIVCVVHQPSSHLMKLFDDLYLISDGYKLYNGPIHDAVNYFENYGFKYPEFYNPADYVLEIACGEYGSEQLKDFIKKTQNTSQTKEMYLVKNTKLGSGNDLQKTRNKEKSVKIFFLQVFLLMKQAMNIQMKDKMCVQLRIIVHLLVGILLGIVFWDFGNDASKILSNSSCLFFFVIFIFFSNAMPSVLSCPLETSIFLRQHLNGWYSIESYFISKTLIDIPLQLLCPTLFISIAYFLTGQPLEFERFAQVWMICFLTTMLGHAVGVMSGSAFDLKLAVFLVPASCIPMLIFSGYFIRKSEMSTYLKPLTCVSYFRYSLEGLVGAIYGGNRTDLNCYSPFCYYRTADKFLKDMDIDGDVAEDVIILIFWILLFHFIFYISLRRKVYKFYSL